jgi:hypothetical protein
MFNCQKVSFSMAEMCRNQKVKKGGVGITTQKLKIDLLKSSGEEEEEKEEAEDFAFLNQVRRTWLQELNSSETRCD